MQPERFELEYVNEAGQKERPVMIHHATLGSIERFLSVFIEHTGGWFPFWCAPEQVRVLTVNNQVDAYVEEVKAILRGVVLDKPLKYNELRFEVDQSDDSLGKKIRRAAELKVPVVLIVGPKDMEERKISVRLSDREEKIGLNRLGDFLRAL